MQRSVKSLRILKDASLVTGVDLTFGACGWYHGAAYRRAEKSKRAADANAQLEKDGRWVGVGGQY